MKAKVPDGLAYGCETLDEAHKPFQAYIRFGGGGYLPGESVRARDNVWDPSSKEGPRPRTTAKLKYGEDEYDMIAEWTQGGLRYRSAKPVSDAGYLVWSLGTALADEGPERWSGHQRPLTPEDARVGLRASADPEDPGQAGGAPVAACRRAGRSGDSDGTPLSHDEGEPDGAAQEHEAPHAR